MEDNQVSTPSSWTGTRSSSVLSSAAGLARNSNEKHVVDVERCAGNPSNADPHDPGRPRLSLHQRLHHFTWAWFALPMSTGGLSLLVYSQPYRFPAQVQIGLSIYIANAILFAVLFVAMVARFCLHRGAFFRSISHAREGFFLPTFFLSIATVITSSQRYVVRNGDTASTTAIHVAFWVYLFVTLAGAAGHYSFLFARHGFDLQKAMPVWIMPIFPVMLSGTIASVIAETQPDMSVVPVVVGGLTCQGLGMSVAAMMYAHMVGRLMQTGLPGREQRPGLFVNVGPPAFTALALIGMAQGLPDKLEGFDAKTVKTVAIIGALFLWTLSLWWFLIAAIAVLACRPKHFHLSWWAMVFPNTGFLLSTISIGEQLKSAQVLWFTEVMSVCLLAMYVFVLYRTIRAVVAQDIMYPGCDEDVDDN
ncbi:voltage-dependent anion channel [Xylariaceae sp. FL0804]|nr:voltage-dependent anion channel [Xylariaceae sp. FL0804]